MPTYNVIDGESQPLVLAPQTPDEIDNINASGSSTVSIDATNGRSYPATVNVNLVPNAQVTLSYNAFNTNFLYVNGDATTTLIDNATNNFSTLTSGAAHVLIQPDIIGTGTFGLDNGATLEFGRAVASTITINLKGITSSAATLKLDQPDAFKGTVNFTDGEVILAGLSQATGYDLSNGVLSIYGGPTNEVIDTLRLTDTSPEKAGLALRVVQGSVQIVEQGSALATGSLFLGGTALTQHVGLPPTSALPTPPVAPPPAPANPPVVAYDGKTGQAIANVIAQAYTGPVQGLLSQFIDITQQNLNIAANVPGLFIHTGSGDDAVALYGGTNVVDGGAGSNFLTAGGGFDTFFVDTRQATADIWSTVAKFRSGDAVTVWGLSAANSTLSWVDGQGAAGATGLTLHAATAGGPTASLTLAGFSKADLASGKISAAFGHDAASGSDYLYVHGT